MVSSRTNKSVISLQLGSLQVKNSKFCISRFPAEAKLIKIIKAIIKAPELTDDDKNYLNELLRVLREGGIAKATMKKILKEIKNEVNPLKILARIKAGVSPNVFQGTFAKSAADTSGPKEVILSEYLVGM